MLHERELLKMSRRTSEAMCSVIQGGEMKAKSLRRTLLSFLAAPLLHLSSVSTPAATDSGILPVADLQAVGVDDQRQRPSFLSNTLLVKFTSQARAKLKIIGEEVSPAATGLPSLNVVCREHGVKRLRSIVSPAANRSPIAAIDSWFKLTLSGSEQRVILVEQTNDDARNLELSGAEPLGRLMRRLKQEPGVEEVAIDPVVQAMFVPNDPHFSTPYPTSHDGNIAQ